MKKGNKQMYTPRQIITLSLHIRRGERTVVVFVRMRRHYEHSVHMQRGLQNKDKQD